MPAAAFNLSSEAKEPIQEEQHAEPQPRSSLSCCDLIRTKINSMLHVEVPRMMCHPTLFHKKLKYLFFLVFDEDFLPAFSRCALCVLERKNGY